MKKILPFISIFLCSIFAYAQDITCYEFLNNMTKAIETNNVEKAKKDMRGFLSCNEEKISNKKNTRWKFINTLTYIFKIDNYYIGVKSNSGIDNINTIYKYWLLDNNYNIIKQLPYDRISKGLGNQLIVSYHNYDKSRDIRTLKIKTGIIDINQNIIVPLEYYSISILEQNYKFFVGENDWNLKMGIMDKNGKTLLEPIDKIFEFSEGLARAVKDGKEGFIDVNGKTIIPFDYDYKYENFHTSFIDGLAPVYKNKKFGYINRFGNIVVPIIYDDIQLFSEDLAGVMIKYDELKNWLWGFVDKNGKIIIEPTYSNISNFQEGFARVKNRNGLITGIGFIDKKGNEVIDLEFDNAGLFKNGIVNVCKNKLVGGVYECNFFYINSKGECVKDCQNKK